MSLALLQLYSSSEPPLVRVSRGPVFSDITSCFRHFTHRVRLYHLEGNGRRDMSSCYSDGFLRPGFGLAGQHQSSKPLKELNDCLPLQGMLGDLWRFPTRWTSGRRPIVSSSCGSSVTLPVTTVSTLTSTVSRFVRWFPSVTQSVHE